jgi:DNA-directed RNA polymerase subunit RPC12/RpoP
VLKLSCVGCGAPLDIVTDLDTFACSYCGLQQQVERKGGVVALKRFEAAINAVQRGTDRTAAELALVRLTKEVADGEAKRKLAIAMLTEKRDKADGSRLRMAMFAFFVAAVVLMVLTGQLVDKFGVTGVVSALLMFVATVVVPLAIAFKVFNNSPVSDAELTRVTGLWDEYLKKLKSQVTDARAMLDEPVR